MSLTRRQLLAWGAGAAAVSAVPVTQHLRWNRQEFQRPDFDPNWPQAPAGESAWMNWSGIQRATPRQLRTVASEAELQTLVREAQGVVRPVGSGHSFCALVPSEDTIVDISPLSGIRHIDADAGLVTLGAGTRLQQTARALASAGLALPNLPDIDVQTLAGSFATATHGTGLTLTALHDYVEAFRLVTASGDVLRVNRESHPELFAAAKVGLGALGVITEYTLRVQPAFKLHRQVWVEPLEDLLAAAEEHARNWRNFEFFYFPNTGYAAALGHQITDAPVTARPPSEDEALLADLRELRDVFGWWPWLRRKVLAASVPTGVVEDTVEESWKLLATSRPTKFNELEYQLPLDAGLPALREVIQRMDQRKEAYFPLEVRFVAQDPAWLSPFNDGPRMSISLHAGVEEAYDYLYTDFEPLLRARGGRPHWGKLHSLGAAELAALYPRFADFQALRTELDPAGRFLNPYLSQLLGAVRHG